MARKPRIPAIPTQITGEMYSLLSSMKQTIEQLESDLAATSAAAARALQYTGISNSDLGVGTGGRVITLDPNRGLLQEIINNGNFVLMPPPTEDAYIVVSVIEGPSPGTITTSSFDRVTGSHSGHGVGSVYHGHVTKINGVAHLEWRRAK